MPPALDEASNANTAVANTRVQTLPYNVNQMDGPHLNLLELSNYHPTDTEKGRIDLKVLPFDAFEPMLRDALTLALPLNPVCKEDCKGLCAHCGNEMTSETCDCTQETTDPRWAELDVLRAGITTVLLPSRNEPDLDDVPESVREQLTVHFVSDVAEVLDAGQSTRQYN